MFDLKGSREDVSDWAGAALPGFPEVPNTRSAEGGCELMWTGPEHWLLCAPLERESELLGLLKPDEAPAPVSVALVSDVYEFFRLEGPHAPEVVSVASPLDYRALPSNAATFTAAFGQKALFIPRGGAFEIGRGKQLRGDVRRLFRCRDRREARRQGDIGAGSRSA